MPGQILGDRYEVEQQLGKKSGRWTLLARDLTTQDPVILKILCIDDEMVADDLKLFQREVETLQTLDYPGTPKYLGYFEIELPKSGKALALIQSYMEGTSLQTYLEQGRVFNQTEAQKIATFALQILTYLHDHEPSIVHRDIKPSNILLTGPDTDPTANQVYLIDFGSVRLSVTSEFTTMTLVGTDGYMPPEQLGRRAVKASDLYSLGITLIAAMSGRPPAQMPREDSIRIDVEQTVRCSPEFSDWLRQMTEPELHKRFSSAQAALTALNALP